MRDHMNVVLNFHKGDQMSAKLLLELLLVVDEGIDCTYYLQYGDPTSTIKIRDTLTKFISRKNASYLTERLSSIEEIEPPSVPESYFSVYQMYTIRLRDGDSRRDGLKDFLNKGGIGAKVYFDPIHLSLFYRRKFGCKEGDLPVTEKISQQVLTLPMYPTLIEDEINYIAETISNFFS